MCIFVAHANYVSYISHMSYKSNKSYMGYVFRYFINYSKSLKVSKKKDFCGIVIPSQ